MSLKLPRPMPPVQTVLGAIDAEGQAAARACRNDTVAAVRRAMPARSGRARAGQRGSVRREANGYVVEVKPSPKVRYPNGVSVAEVTRWLEGGTGVYGPRHHVILPRRAEAFHLPSGWRNIALKGQRAQHLYARVQGTEEARATRTLMRGADDAARAAERVIAEAVR